MRKKTKRENNLVQVRNTVYRTMPNNLYHNFLHAVDVHQATIILCDTYPCRDITPENRYLIRTAAWLQNVIMIPGNTDSKKLSAKFAEEYLPKLDYTDSQISLVSDMILATNPPINPQGTLQKIICDANIAIIGRPDFFDRSKLMFQELKLPFKDLKKFQKTFLQNNRFYSDTGKCLYKNQHEANLRRLSFCGINFESPYPASTDYQC